MPDIDACFQAHPLIVGGIILLSVTVLPLLVVLAFARIMYWWANRR